MSHSPLSMARRHVLGTLYSRCEALTDNVPVFITPAEGDDGEPALTGHVSQTADLYADAFIFDLPDDVCKQLSAGYYSYSFEYEHADPGLRGSRGPIRLSSISLIARQNYTKPIPRGSVTAKDTPDLA